MSAWLAPKALRFANDAALTAAITSQLVPSTVAAAPARAWRDQDGTLRVLPSEKLSKEQWKTLAQAGAASVDVDKGGVEVSCWAEILPPRAIGEPTELDHAMFIVPDETSLLELAGEMLRLGCDRQQLRAAGSRYLLRVVGPPYYTVARALDRAGGLRAFVGRERVFTEVGWDHPLASLVRAGQDSLLFIGGDGKFSQLPDGKDWIDVYQRIELVLPPAGQDTTARPLAHKLQVPLKLARAGRTEPPSLWVVRDEPEAQIDALVQTLPDDIIERLLFAPATAPDGKALVLIKARPGPKGPPELSLRAPGYAPLLQIANLFVPTDAIVEPPLRRDLVRKLLVPDGDALRWLEPKGHGSFVVQSLAERALAPLSDWIDYVIDRGAGVLEPWVRGASFAFEAFESTGGEWGEAPPPLKEEPEEEPAHKHEKKKRRARAAEPATEYVAPAPATKRAAAADTTPLVMAADPAPLVKELAAVERRFLDLDAPADAPERGPLWLEMAQLNTRLGRRRDAGLCWTRAVWEASADDAAALGARWAQAETLAAPSATAMTSLLTEKAPDRDHIRALAALTLAESATLSDGKLRERAAALTGFFDRFDDDLDLRSLWLARLALSLAVGGDALGLSRARDRVLAKLHRGLSIERDVPTFLRFVGGGERGETSAADRLVRELEALRVTFDKTDRTRSTVEAPLPLTRAYVNLIFAYGNARLGQSDKARALAQAAMTALDLKDPVHGFLARAYRARVEHALEGQPLETPLPADVAGELNNLERFLRYKVDRLRQFSTVLEPQERLDPMVAFHRGEKDPRGEEFTSLRGETNRQKLAADIAQLFEVARKSPPDDRARLFDGLMDFFPQIPESQALPQLETLVLALDGIAPPRQSQLLEEALMLAGHFGRGELVKQILARLKPLLAELGAEHVGDAASTVATSLRALRRVGLRDEAVGLLDSLGGAASGDGTPLILARLHLAGGNLYLGQIDRAQPVLAEALAKLNGTLNMTDRLQLVKGVARAVAHAPQEIALETLAKLTRQLPQVSDSFNTNSHFCLSVIAFMESLILGYASEDLALGELGRQWLDEDEYLIRRRVHRDLKAIH